MTAQDAVPDMGRRFALRLADQIDLDAVLIALRHKGMARLCAEMRHVDHGGGIIGSHAQDRARGQRLQTFARLEHGKRT